ncbi:MAG: hypothetical protein PHN31_00550 [Candidatus Gracilibacteria bacterium]|nr:hypothetical protein [Candidatus Gracilibacteria bacterium]
MGLDIGENIGMLPSNKLIELFKIFGVDEKLASNDSIEVCDLGAGIPHFSNQILLDYSNLKGINCIDPIYKTSKNIKETLLNIIEDDYRNGRDWVFSNYQVGVKLSLMDKFKKIIENEGINSKLNFFGGIEEIAKGSQDLVFANFVFNFILFPREMLEKINSILSDNGEFVILDFDSYSFNLIKDILNKNHIEHREGQLSYHDINYTSISIPKKSLEKILLALNEGVTKGLDEFEIELYDWLDGEKFMQKYSIIPIERIVDGKLSNSEIKLINKVFKNEEKIIEEIDHYRETLSTMSKEGDEFHDEEFNFILTNIIVYYENNNLDKPVQERDYDTLKEIFNFFQNKRH